MPGFSAFSKLPVKSHVFARPFFTAFPSFIFSSLFSSLRPSHFISFAFCFFHLSFFLAPFQAFKYNKITDIAGGFVSHGSDECLGAICVGVWEEFEFVCLIYGKLWRSNIKGKKSNVSRDPGWTHISHLLALFKNAAHKQSLALVLAVCLTLCIDIFTSKWCTRQKPRGQQKQTS